MYTWYICDSHLWICSAIPHRWAVCRLNMLLLHLSRVWQSVTSQSLIRARRRRRRTHCITAGGEGDERETSSVQQSIKVHSACVSSVIIPPDVYLCVDNTLPGPWDVCMYVYMDVWMLSDRGKARITQLTQRKAFPCGVVAGVSQCISITAFHQIKAIFLKS